MNKSIYEQPPTLLLLLQGGKREENVALLLSIQQALREAGQLNLPRLRFHEAVPESVRQVRTEGKDGRRGRGEGEEAMKEWLGVACVFCLTLTIESIAPAFTPWPQSLQRIAEAHAATVLPSTKGKEAGKGAEAATHIVHWDPDGLDKGLPRRLLRR